MRAIQAGILVCLAAIAGLLTAVYRQQAELLERGAAVAAAPPVEAVRTPEPPAGPLAADAFQPPAPVAAPAPRAKPRPIAAPAPRRSEAIYAPPAPAGPPEVRIPAPPPVEAPPPASAVYETIAATPAMAPPAPPREPRQVTLPAGLTLVARLENTLSTARNRPGDSFVATLAEPLILEGLIVADRGARVEGRVVESRQAGRVKGRAAMELSLVSLATDDGQRIAIETETYAVDGPSSRNGDLKRIGVGAGAGALLGAIFGGGKGAAIGAGAGAGAGAGVGAVQRGEPAVLAPETRLQFRLARAVTVVERL